MIGGRASYRPQGSAFSLGVVTRTKDDSTLTGLAASVASEAPRLIVLCAPVGYRKAAFLRAYAAGHVGAFVGCDIADGPRPVDLARGVLDALVARDGRRAGDSAADRLAQRTEAAGANAREALRREWARCEQAHLFALRDVDGALATPNGVDLFAELVGANPPARVVALSSRLRLPPALLQIAEVEGAKMIAAADLALSEAATADVAAAAGLPSRVGRAIYRMTGGWPLMSGLLAGLAGSGEHLDHLGEAAATLSPEAFLGFAAHRTIVRLDETVRDALGVTALLRRASHVELVRILGDVCDDLVFARLTNLPFVERSGEHAVVHPAIAAVLSERFSPLVRSLYERTLNALTGDGAYVKAAHLALDRDDVERAAAIIDAAPPYTSVPIALHEYERVIDRLDRAQLTSFPNLWIATIPFRSFAVDRATFVREAETVYYCLPPTSGPDQRAAALMLLASAYFNSGRRADADRLVDEALRGFARDPIPARASLLHFCAWVHGMDGRFAAARAYAAEAAQVSRGKFGENQTLHYIDAHEAAYRGENDRIVAIVDELLRRTDALPLHVANTAANGALFTWTNGDDLGCRRYVGLLEEALTPGLERGFRPIIDAARGRAVGPPDPYLWSVAYAHAQLFRLEHTATAEEALDAARIAARCADDRGDPYTQLLAHTALYVLDAGNRAGEAAMLEAIVAPIESEEMQSAVRGLVRGEGAGILEPFVRRRVLRERAASSTTQLEVELLTGRVVRNGAAIKLSDKEFELLALLGSAHAPLSRDRIGEALWDHLDPEEWPNNLKVTLSRLRTKLAMRDAVLLLDGRYRLSPLIDVDLRRAEAVLRESLGKALGDAARVELAELFAAYRSGATGRYDRVSWAQQLSARIEDLVCRAGVILAEDAFARGRPDEALRFTRDVSEFDPLNEGACETALRVLLAAGEVDAARRELKRYAASLAAELGAAPAARLVELVRASGS